MNPSIRNMPEHFGGLQYQDLTIIHPLALVVVIILGVAMMVVSRRWSILPMLIVACFISSVQRIAVFGLDFNLLRIMVLFGTARLLFHKEYVGFIWKPLDTAIVLWIISSMLFYTLQQGTFSAFVNRLGLGFDAFGMYFLFRCLIRDWLDVDTVIFGTLLISIPVALFFILENRTGHNVFSIFGGVPEITKVRMGRLRCQGAFSHAILAGCFWASLMPLFVAHWWKSANDKVLAITGLVTSSTIVICCASSTPIMGVLSGIIGGLLFFVRRKMRLVRWAVLLTVIALHIVMNTPIWHLVSRVSAVGGSTGWHRYNLINQAITRFDEWFLLGTKSTAHWGWGLQDMTNQYILEGTRGGFLTLCFFVAVITVAFREVGKLWRTQSYHRFRLALSWALGTSLFIHCISFIGVSYFGQIWIIWYLLLAMIGSLSISKKLYNSRILDIRTKRLKVKPFTLRR